MPCGGKCPKDPILGPIWRNGAFAGEFGDAFIADTELEGGHTAPAIRTLIDVLKPTLVTRRSELSLLKDEDIDLILLACDDLEIAAQIDAQRDEIDDSKDFAAFLGRFVKKLADIPVGGRLAFTGGWMRTNGGHAIMHVAERTDLKTYAFVVANTGAGVQYHPSSGHDYPKTKHQCAIRMPNIPADQFLDENAWYMFWKLRVTPKDENGLEIFYEVFLPHLVGTSVTKAVEDDKANCGFFETIQRSGTCFFRCILTCFRYLLKSKGMTKDQIKQTTHVLRLAFMDRVTSDLDRLETKESNDKGFKGYNESDLIMIRLGCSQTALSAVKQYKRGQISAENLASIKANLEAIQQRAQDLQVENPDTLDFDEGAEIELNMVESAPLVPFHGFDLLANQGNADRFAGGPMEAAPEMFVDLVDPPVSITTFEMLKEQLTKCRDRCDKLRAKTSVSAASIAIHQIVCLIEYTFCNVIPLPKPKGSEEEKDCLYSNCDGIELEDQQEALEALKQVALHYSAGTWSARGDRATESNKAITAACMLAVFDALLRIVASPPSPLSVLLAGMGDSTVTVGDSKSDDVLWPSVTNFTGQKLSDLTSSMMFLSPDVCIARDKALQYLEGSKDSKSSKKLFDWTPEANPTFKLPETGATSRLVQKLMEKLNLEFVLPPMSFGRRGGRGGASDPNAMSEIEKRARWLTAPSWEQLPEFSLYRDMIFLYKLMLESADLFFLRNYQLPQSSLWFTSQVSPHWQFWDTNQDNTSAGIRVTILDTKYNISFSVGRAQPGNSLELIMGRKGCTEETVLQKRKLPSWGDTLGPEEAEKLISFLTTPYLAPPLLLDFFSQDRVGQLLNPGLQDLLESALFEAKKFMPEAVTITTVPVPHEMRDEYLGTRWGIMMQELIYSPDSVLSPLISCCKAADALCIGDYNSPFCQLLTFFVRMATRIESFYLFIQNKRELKSLQFTSPQTGTLLNTLQNWLRVTAKSLLRKWLKQATKAGNVEKGTEFHCHLALLHGNISDEKMSSEDANSFLCSVAYTVSWHSGSHGLIERDRGQMMRSLRAMSRGQPMKEAFATPTLPVPVHDVFYILQRRRSSVLNWAKAASTDELDSILARVASVALWRQNLAEEDDAGPAWRGWQPVSEKPLLCSYEIESDHPYAASTDFYESVSFPGAPYVALYFDSQSQTEELADYVTIYQDDTYTTVWGEKKYSGSSNSGWPGAGGRPPLMIPADHFSLHFHSDASTEDWGFKVRAIAPVSADATNALLTELKDKDGNPYPLPVIQKALANSMNCVDRARKYIHDNLESILEEIKVEEEEAQLKTTDDNVNGLYRDPMGSVQINLQTGEVYLRNRMLMPVPSDIGTHKDFTAVFGNGSLFCAVKENSVNRRLVSIPHSDNREYEVSAWKPINNEQAVQNMAAALQQQKAKQAKQVKTIDDKKEDEKEVPREASTDSVEQKKRVAISAANFLGGLPDQGCFNMPKRGPDGALVYDSHTFVPYAPASCGWLSDIFDPLLAEAMEMKAKSKKRDDSESMSERPIIWVSEATLHALKNPDSIIKLSGDRPPLVGQLLMYVPPQGDLEEQKGHPGGFFDLHALFDRKVIHVYALVEEGRKMQRVLIYTSDCRAAFHDLMPDFEEREKPWLPGCRHAAGNLFDTVLDSKGKLIPRAGAGNQAGSKVGSLIIKRTRVPAQSELQAAAQALDEAKTWGEEKQIDPEDPLGLGELDTETFIPNRVIQGLIPDALIGEYTFWQTGPTTIRGYPRKPDNQTALLILLQMQVFFRTSDNSAVAVEANGEEPCAVVTERASKKAAIAGVKLTSTSQDFEGRSLDDDATISQVGAGRWVAVVKRLPHYASKEDLMNDEAVEENPEEESDPVEIEELSDDSDDKKAGADPADNNDDAETCTPKKKSMVTMSPPLVLLNLLRAPPSDNILRRLYTLFARIENISNILVWSVSSTHSAGDQCKISLVELPRLKARFEVRVESDGTVRLASLDYDGLYVSNRPFNNKVMRHAKGLPHVLVLENILRDSFLFVPNYGLNRPKIDRCPFSTEVITDRSKEWFNNVKTRFYVYSVHLSGAFIQSKSLSAGLYLIFLRLMARQYEQASRLISTCATDSALSKEESWIISLIKRSEDDSHPDANANRARLALICQETGTQPSWDVAKDVEGYFKKLSHVSTSCRLNYQDEQDLKPNQQRQAYLQALKKTELGEEVKIPIPGNAPSCAGGKFVDMMSKSHEMLKKMARGYTTSFKYSKPADDKQSGSGALAILEDVFNDSMNGRKHKTGFPLLYQMLTGHCNLRVLSEPEDEKNKEEEEAEAGADTNAEADKIEEAKDKDQEDENKDKDKDEDKDKDQDGGQAQEDTKYSCPTCTMFNQKTARACIMCETPNPYYGQVAAPTSIAEVKSEPSKCIPLCKLVIKGLYIKYTKKFKEDPPVVDYIGLAILLPMLHAALNGYDMSNFPVFPYAKNKQQLEDGTTTQAPGSIKTFSLQCAKAATAYFDSEVYKKATSEPMYPGVGIDAIAVIPAGSRLKQRPCLSDCASSERILEPLEFKSESDMNALDLSKDDIIAFATNPLKPLKLDQHICFVDAPTDLEVMDELPFQLTKKSKHATKAKVAQDMLNRMNKDLGESANKIKSGRKARLSYLSDVHIQSLRQDLAKTTEGSVPALTRSLSERDIPGKPSLERKATITEKGAEMLGNALTKLEQLAIDLEELRETESNRIAKGVKCVEDLANAGNLDLPASSTSDAKHDDSKEHVESTRTAFLLERFAGQQLTLWFELVAAGVLSSKQLEDMQSFNPFLAKDDVEQVMRGAAGVMFRCVRLSQINFCLKNVSQLISNLHKLVARRLQVGWAANSSNVVAPSPEMIKIVLERCGFSEHRAREEIIHLCEIQHKLNQSFIESTSGIPEDHAKAMVAIAYHKCDFDADQTSQILEDLSLCQHLLSLARRGCYYKGQRLYRPKPPSSNHGGDDEETEISDDEDEQQKRRTQSSLRAMVHALQHTAQGVAGVLTASRGYTNSCTDGQGSFDPRFLVFEYLVNFMLRPRQVELINDFVKAARKGDSSVHQMIMGAGKTTVIGPMLALILADGKSLVTQVVPKNLLRQTEGVLRQAFSNVIAKRIYSLSFDRAATLAHDVTEINKLYDKLCRARRERAIVCSTPESIKSLMLKYIDHLQGVQAASPVLHVPQDRLKTQSAKALKMAQQLRTNALCADALARIIKLWGHEEHGVALLDEVDMVLHPLRSELNFPIGSKEKLPLNPMRWEMPAHLLDAFFYSDTNRISLDDFRPDSAALSILRDIAATMEKGVQSRYMMKTPHPVLLSDAFYGAKLLPLVAQWAMIFLKGNSQILSDIETTVSNSKSGSALQKDQAAAAAEEEQKQKQKQDEYECKDGVCRLVRQTSAGPKGTGYSESDVEENILTYISNTVHTEQVLLARGMLTEHFSPLSIALINLAKDWVCQFLPHCLSKINRVAYGLLHKEDVDRWEKIENKPVEMSATRKMLAVPFVGKDVPSRNSEFAHPEVLIGLTICAYRYEGLRRDNVAQIVSVLKDELLQQPGPFAERPAFVQFDQWLKIARLDRARKAGVSATDEDGFQDGLEVLPLHLFQKEDEDQLNCLVQVLSLTPEVINYFLMQLTFDKVMRHQMTKLQASGVDLGSDMLFDIRLGFSGTPSDLLPEQLKPCHYEKGSEASIIRVLTSPQYVEYTRLKNWDVTKLLNNVATHTPPFHALIDTGALVTGMSNEEVARYLLHTGLDHVDACVFLDSEDSKMVVDRSDGAPVPLSRCGVSPDRYFTFYDQVHTTGMDIKQSLDACAAVTLGKDMTLRDYAQGCYRMRGLTRGQTLNVIVVDEIASLIRKASRSDNKLFDVVGWLVVNSIRSEKLQHLALCQQSLCNIWRRSAFKELLKSQAPSDDTKTSASLISRFAPSIVDEKAIDGVLDEYTVLTDADLREMEREEEKKKATARLKELLMFINQSGKQVPFNLEEQLRRTDSIETLVGIVTEMCVMLNIDTTPMAERGDGKSDGKSDGAPAEEPFDFGTPFNCSVCTFANPRGGSCGMCGTPRDVESERKAIAEAKKKEEEARAALRYSINVTIEYGAVKVMKENNDNNSHDTTGDDTPSDGTADGPTAQPKQISVEVDSPDMLVSAFRRRVREVATLEAGQDFVLKLPSNADDIADPDQKLLEEAKSVIHDNKEVEVDGEKQVTTLKLKDVQLGDAKCTCIMELNESSVATTDDDSVASDAKNTVLAEDVLPKYADGMSEEDALAYALALSLGAKVDESLEADERTDGPGSDNKESQAQEEAAKPGGMDDFTWLSSCITMFRERLELDIPDEVPEPIPFSKRLEQWSEENKDFIHNGEARSLVAQVLQEVAAEEKAAKSGSSSSGDNKASKTSGIVDAVPEISIDQSTPFNCAICTYFNATGGLRCDICSSPRDLAAEIAEATAKAQEEAKAKKAASADSNPGDDSGKDTHSDDEVEEDDFDDNLSAGADLAENLSLDASMISEQSKEQEMAVDIIAEEVVQVEYKSNENGSIQWDVKDLLSASKMIPRAFYGLNTFCPTKSVEALPFPPSVLISENYATYLHRSDLQRRLKNINVVMDWAPAQVAAKQAVRLVDSKDSGWIGASYRRSMAQAAGKTEEEFLADEEKHQKKMQEMLDVEAPHRYCVALSLEEAQTMRRVLQLTQNQPVEGTITGLMTVTNLWLSAPTSGPNALVAEGTEACKEEKKRLKAHAASLYEQLLEANLDQKSAREQSMELALQTAGLAEELMMGVQCLRFFDNQMWFEEDEAILVLRALTSVPESVRRTVFEQTIICRRRDMTKWQGTGVSNVFAHTDEKQLLRLRELTLRVSVAIMQGDVSLLDIFNKFDVNGDGWLSQADLTKALLPLNIGLSEADISELLIHADQNSDGFLNYFEFAASFTRGMKKGPGADSNADKLVASKKRKNRSSAGAMNKLAMMKKKNEAASKAAALREDDAGEADYGAKHLTYAQLSALCTLFLHSGGRAIFHGDNQVSTRPGYRPTIAPRGIQFTSGQWYYEVTVITAGRATIGWADELFKSNYYTGHGVGDDVHSWGFDGHNVVKRHKGVDTPWGYKWGSGDVIGTSVDMETGTISYSHNGEWLDPVGDAFTGISFHNGLTPMVSFDTSFQFRVNFGEKPFRYPPPTRSTRSVRHWARQRMQEIHALNSGSMFGKLKPTTGDAQMELTEDNVLTVSSGFPSAVLQGVLLTSGKWYYEFTLIRPGVAQVGWADLDFIGSTNDGVGVGDDKHSWGYDGNRILLWFNGRNHYGRRWHAGDVIGCGVDIDNRSIRFSHNGSWAAPMGVAMENMEFTGGLSPGITLNPCSLQANFGERKFAYAPPPGYSAVNEWIKRNNPFEPYVEEIEEDPTDQKGEDNTSSSSSSDGLGNGLGGADDDLQDDLSPPVLRHTLSSLVVPTSESSKIGLRVSSGYSQALITRKTNSAGATANYPSVVADRVLLTYGKWYFEAQCLEVTGNEAVGSIGWGDKLFFGDYLGKQGVGDDYHSWGLCMRHGVKSQVSKLHGKEVQDFSTVKWKSGTTISCAVDLKERVIWYAVNGEWQKAYEDCYFDQGVVPACSLNRYFKTQFNFGDRKLKYDPPTPNFKPVHEWLEEEKERVSKRESRPVLAEHEGAKKNWENLQASVSKKKAEEEQRRKQEAELEEKRKREEGLAVLAEKKRRYEAQKAAAEEKERLRKEGKTSSDSGTSSSSADSVDNSTDTKLASIVAQLSSLAAGDDEELSNLNVHQLHSLVNDLLLSSASVVAKVNDIIAKKM